MDLSITEDQTQGSHSTYQATSRRALWWMTAVLLAGIIAIVLPIQKIRLLGLQLGGTIGSYTTPPPSAPQYAAISPGGSSLTVTWSQVPAATSYSIYRSDKTYNGHPYPIGSGNSTSGGSFTDQGATSGGPYTYWVTASNGGAESGGSPSVSATVNTPTPPAPAHGKLIVSGGSIKAYFSTVSGASSYNAYRDGWLMQKGVTSPYTDGGVPVGTSHWYTFGAVNSNGQGSMGPYYLSATGGATPPVTTNLAATAGNSSVQLSWNVVTDANGGSVSYNLYRSSSAGGEGDIPVQNWISSNNSGPMSYTDTGLNPGTTYYYKVAAVSNMGGGEGTLSNEASATPVKLLLPVPLLPAPNLSGAPGDSSALLTWTTIAGASSYNVYRNNEYVPLGTSDNGKVPLVEVGASGTTYTDSGLTNGAWYYYTVNAVSTDGQGLGSQSVSVVPGSVSPTLATHIVWTSDYTVTPNVQTGSTSGTVGGNTSVHLSLQAPPNLTSAVAKTVTIHEDAGDTTDIVTTNATFTVANYSNNYSGWSAVCGDPDPAKSGSPSMAYCDVGWSSYGAHQGKYTITVTGLATVGNSFTPVTVTSTIHVDREDLVITSTAPAYPAPLVVKTVDASGNPVALTPLSLSMTVTAASKMLVPATITVYDLNQNPVATLRPTTPAPSAADSVVVGGPAAGGTTISYTWNGYYDPVPMQAPVPAPDGLYSYKCNIGGSTSPCGMYDTNISSSLTITPSLSATVVDDGTTATYDVRFTMTDSQRRAPAAGALTFYDGSFNQKATLDLSQSNPADYPNPNGLTLSLHDWSAVLPPDPFAGITTSLLTADAGKNNPDHVLKIALATGKRDPKFAAVVFAATIADPTYPIPQPPTATNLYGQSIVKLGFGRLKTTPLVNMNATPMQVKSAFIEATPQAHSLIRLAIFEGHGGDSSDTLTLSGDKATPNPTLLLTYRTRINMLNPAAQPNAICPAELAHLSDLDLAILCGCSQAGNEAYNKPAPPNMPPAILNNANLAFAFCHPLGNLQDIGVKTALAVGAPLQANWGVSIFLSGDRVMNGKLLTDGVNPDTVYKSMSDGFLAYYSAGMTVMQAAKKATDETRAAELFVFTHVGKLWPDDVSEKFDVAMQGDGNGTIHK